MLHTTDNTFQGMKNLVAEEISENNGVTIKVRRINFESFIVTEKKDK